MAILIQSNKKPSVSYPEQTGAIITFNSQYAGLPLKAHKVAVTATQSGSGTPSPDNVRPISGHDIIIISHSGADTSNPTVHTIQIGSTVYGGEYDARTGVLTVTHKGGIFDGSADENWQYHASSTSFYLENAFVVDNSFRTSNICTCNYLKESQFILNSADMRDKPDNIFCNQDWWYSHRLWVKMTQFSDATTFKAYLANNPLVIVYPLSTPQTIQLPPCLIDTLEGVNNIWADTGDTTAQYIKIG